MLNKKQRHCGNVRNLYVYVIMMIIVDCKVPFLRRAHSPNRPPLDSNQKPADYEGRAISNAPPGTLMHITTLFFQQKMEENH